MNEARRCTATGKATGERCKKAAILGGTVCQKHGGGAPQVKAKAAERLADLIDPDRALREAARLAYSDIRELFDADGNMLPVKQWPDHLAAAIASVEVVKKQIAGKREADDVIKVRVWDKPKNLDMLFRHMGLLTERMEMKLEASKSLGELLDLALSRRRDGDSGA